jgi:hypothetical protein
MNYSTRAGHNQKDMKSCLVVRNEKPGTLQIFIRNEYLHNKQDFGYMQKADYLITDSKNGV